MFGTPKFVGTLAVRPNNLNTLKSGPNCSISLYSLFSGDSLKYGALLLTLTKSDLRSLDFAVNRFLMKIFRSNNSEVIAE